MLNEPSDSPKKNTSESPSPAWKPNRGMLNVAAQNTSSPRAAPAPPLQSAGKIRRPGCVTITAAAFFLISLFNLLGLLQTILLFDVLLMIATAAQIAVLLAIVYGLMEMFRWGANLVIIYCAATILQSILQAIYMSLIIGDYLDSQSLETFYIIVISGIFLVFTVILGLVINWFVRVRKWFLPGNLPEVVEHRLYLLAIIVMLLSTIVSVVAVPEVLESQQPIFDDINRQSQGLQ